MKDTTPEAQQLQRDIIHSKTAQERTMMGIDMTESTRKIVINSIRNKKPHLNEREVIAERFERYYSQEFSQEEIQVIKKEIIQYRKD